MGIFEKGFNKAAKQATALNKGINKVIGKDVFGEVRQIEPEREYEPYESFPPYEESEPDFWSQKKGEERSFSFCGGTIIVPRILDECMQYIPDFESSAKYYTELFKYKHNVCVNKKSKRLL